MKYPQKISKFWKLHKVLSELYWFENDLVKPYVVSDTWQIVYLLCGTSALVDKFDICNTLQKNIWTANQLKCFTAFGILYRHTWSSKYI